MSKRNLISFKSDDEKLKAFKVLEDELGAAYLDYRIHHKILELARQNKSAYERTWPFWLPVLGSLLNSTVLCLCRIYDKDYRTTGLHVILTKLSLSSSQNVNPLLAKDLLLVGKSDPVVKRLTIWRNELLAHSNFERASGLISPDRKQFLLNDDVRILIDRGLDIYSRYAGLDLKKKLSDAIMDSDRQTEFIFETINARVENELTVVRQNLRDHGVNPDCFLKLDPRFDV